MAVIRIALTDINVNVYFPPILPLEEVVIKGGTGFFTLFEDLGDVHYVLEVDSGTRVNTPRVGEVVVASGKDSEGRLIVPSGKLETVSAGTPAVFRGPYA